MTSRSGGLILLAAGSGSRFGSDKRQHRLANGHPLLGATLRLHQSCFRQIVVVLRPGDEALGAKLLADSVEHPQTEVVYAEMAAQGMGHSLARGAQGLLAQSAQPYFSVGLADMPYLQPSTVRQLQELCLSMEPPFIVQPRYRGKAGNPVFFSASHLPSLLLLQGDQGARGLIKECRDQLHQVSVTDPGVLHDVDRPEDILP